LQAVNWIKKKEDKEMKVLNLNDGPGVFIKFLETAIRYGKSILFENIDEELDPTLDPILEKNFQYKMGKK
jgi:dynein heavy chain